MQIVVKLMHARSTTVLQVGEGAESSLEELSTRHFKVAATQVKSAHQGRKAAGTARERDPLLMTLRKARTSIGMGGFYLARFLAGALLLV